MCKGPEDDQVSDKASQSRLTMTDEDTFRDALVVTSRTTESKSLKSRTSDSNSSTKMGSEMALGLTWDKPKKWSERAVGF